MNQNNRFRKASCQLTRVILAISLLIQSCISPITFPKEGEEGRGRIILTNDNHKVMFYIEDGKLQALTLKVPPIGFNEQPVSLPVYIEPSLLGLLINRLPEHERKRFAQTHSSLLQQNISSFKGKELDIEKQYIDESRSQRVHLEKEALLFTEKKVEKAPKAVPNKSSKECQITEPSHTSYLSRDIGILALPIEILQKIIAYLPFDNQISIRQLNLFFYTLITGYDRVGMVGVVNKPNYKTNMAICEINQIIDFRQSPYRAMLIPSFLFYQLMGTAKSLPQAYWPYLQDTQANTVDVSQDKLGPPELESLCNCLQKTKVHTIYLGYNKVGIEGIKSLFMHLPGTHVKKIKLNGNSIESERISEFAQYLPYTRLEELDLSHNNIGDKGVIELANYLQGSSIKKINLGNNKISPIGAKKFIKRLKGTSIEELYLGWNKIQAAGAMIIAKKLAGTDVQKLGLSGNKITGSQIDKVIAPLKHTKVHTIYLSYNYILNEDAKGIAMNLQGSQVKKVYLRYQKNPIVNPMREEIKKDLREKYSHIKWIF